MRGGRGRDSMYGGAGDDVMNGGRGRDNMYGQGGDDTINGGGRGGFFGGIFGRAENLNGGSGDDIINGRPDNSRSWLSNMFGGK